MYRIPHYISAEAFEAMKEFYDILDIPLTATPAEIKAQYRQLVRVYHPDLFRNRDDKAYAEEKLKEINIAFQVLSGTSVRPGPFEARVAPQPIAYPPQLDFGTLQVGQHAKRNLQIGNLGGPAETIEYVYSNTKPWFQLSTGTRVYAEQPFPLNFELRVDARRLKPNQLYQEWVEIVLDGMPVRVGVQLQTVAGHRTFATPIRFAWTAVAALLLLAALFLPSLFGISLPTDMLSGALLSARPAYELRPAEMLFSVENSSVENNDGSMLYVGSGMENAPRRLGFSGDDAVATQTGQHIAYLYESGIAQQIFLFDLAEGKTRQLTRSSAAKSMLAWSIDGQRLGYLVGEGKNRRIGIYDVRGGQEYLLPSETLAGVEQFVWSPDGQSLLFDLWHGEEQRVYRIGVHGNDLRQLTHFDSWVGAWSPDGTHILVSTDNGLYRLSNSGQQLHQLTGVAVVSSSWSADGQWIAYTTRDTQHETTTVAMADNVTARARQRATASVSTTSTKETSAAQGVVRQISGNQILWIMDRNGKEVHRVAADQLWHQWSPDGATLGYTTGNIMSEEPLLYLWTVTPETIVNAAPSLIAEVNKPFFAWPR